MDLALEARIPEAAKRLIERGATAVYMFGSVATGRSREERPVDLLALECHPELAESLFRAGELRRVA